MRASVSHDVPTSRPVGWTEEGCGIGLTLICDHYGKIVYFGDTEKFVKVGVELLLSFTQALPAYVFTSKM